MYRGINKEILKWFIVLFILTFSIRFCLDSIFPKLEFFYYQCNAEKYVVVDGEVIDSRKVIVIPWNHRVSVLTRRENTVQYVIGGIKYTQKTYAYPDVKEPTRIRIAVKINKHTDIRRCIEYHFSETDRRYLCRVFIIIIISIGILYVNDYIIRRKDKKYMKNHPVSEHEKSFDEQVAEKQLYIHEHMPQCGVAEEDLQKLTERFAEKGIKFNKGTLWLIMHYSGSQEMSDIFNLLPLIWEGKYFEYIEKLHEQGLLENYYVLAEQDEKYYCCCGESEWLYIYSKGTGITHTQHEVIYDYIIEQVDNKTEG